MRGVQPSAEVLLSFKRLDAAEISCDDISISRDGTNVGLLFAQNAHFLQSSTSL